MLCDFLFAVCFDSPFAKDTSPWRARAIITLCAGPMGTPMETSACSVLCIGKFFY